MDSGKRMTRECFKMKCPQCGCEDFYVKAPDDEYETCELKMRDGRVEFTSAADASRCPELREETETFCDRCSWHGKLHALTGNSD